MGTTYEELFRAMSQFRKLKFSDMFPNISRAEFFTMSMIMDKGENGKITISELATKAHVLLPAMSRTLRGLENKGYVERNVNKQDRRNTYVELTEQGKKITLQTRTSMCEFGRAVMEQVDEEEMKRLISYLNHIYVIAEKEIKTRKTEDRKEQEDEEHI